MRAIDLYAGVGGWALGLKMAGIDVVSSYEWWETAAATHRANLDGDVHVTNIREMDLSTLPKNIDIVIGSPPCTQFSYSNRGGAGDLADGLKDLERFLAVVRHLKPRFWALENVPRVQKVLVKETKPGGALSEYADLFEDASIEVFDMSTFGLPQRRKRCIAGNFDFGLLASYAERTKLNTLGNVVQSLKKSTDPIYAGRSTNHLFDNEPEEALNWEEARFNRDMKEAHPVYNGMAFPDPLNRSSRTVTATCTRVSRESLIVPGNKSGSFRRLSVRERASLQGFPIEYQFLGKSHAEKLKMIGNAIPPHFTYFIAEAIKRTPTDNLVLPESIDANALLESATPIKTRPDTYGRSYPENRRFRFAIPNLRFKSGTRFELSNIDGFRDWSVSFFFGDSKHVLRHDFTAEEIDTAISLAAKPLAKALTASRDRIRHVLPREGLSTLQSVWTQRAEGVHPFVLLDELGGIAAAEIDRLRKQLGTGTALEEWIVALLFEQQSRQKISLQKLKSYSAEIAVGATLTAEFNPLLLSARSESLAAA